MVAQTDKHFQNIYESYFSVSHSVQDTGWPLLWDLPCREPAEHTLPLHFAPFPCPAAPIFLPGGGGPGVARDRWSHGSVPLNSGQASWLPTGNKACFPLAKPYRKSGKKKIKKKKKA